MDFQSLGDFVWRLGVPSGELTVCNGKSPFLMGKSTISMAIFHCYVSSPEGNKKDTDTLTHTTKYDSRPL